MQRKVDPTDHIYSEVVDTEFCATDNPNYFLLIQKSLSGSHATVTQFLRDIKALENEHNRSFTARQSPYPSMVSCSITIAIFLYYLAMHERTPWKFLLAAGVIMGLCYDLYSKPGKHSRALAVKDLLINMRREMEITADLPVDITEKETVTVMKQTKPSGLTIVRTMFNENWLEGREPREIRANAYKLVIADIKFQLNFPGRRQ